MKKMPLSLCTFLQLSAGGGDVWLQLTIRAANRLTPVFRRRTLRSLGHESAFLSNQTKGTVGILRFLCRSVDEPFGMMHQLPFAAAKHGFIFAHPRRSRDRQVSRRRNDGEP